MLPKRKRRNSCDKAQSVASARTAGQTSLVAIAARTMAATRAMYSAARRVWRYTLGKGMLRLRIAPMLALIVLLSVSLSSHAFFDPPYVTPAHPVAGETVSINVRMGVCDGIFNEPGFPRVTQNGSSVHIVVAGSHLDLGGELCSYPTGTGTFPIGSFTPGNYVVSFDLLYIDFFGQPQTLHLGDVPFTVARPAQPAVPAPTLNQLGLLTLTLAVLGFATWRLRGSSALLVAILCMPLGVRAQAVENRMIEIMVTNAPGAPKPAQIVSHWRISHPAAGKT